MWRTSDAPMLADCCLLTAACLLTDACVRVRGAQSGVARSPSPPAHCLAHCPLIARRATATVVLDPAAARIPSPPVLHLPPLLLLPRAPLLLLARQLPRRRCSAQASQRSTCAVCARSVCGILHNPRMVSLGSNRVVASRHRWQPRATDTRPCP